MTKDKLRKLYNIADELDLSGATLLLSEHAPQECNGIGADWMPGWSRRLLTFLLPRISIAAAIHDMRYFIGGNNTDRKNADEEFLQNATAIIGHYYWWFPWLRRKLMNIVEDMFFILRMAGKKAWDDANKKRLEHWRKVIKNEHV